MGAEQKLTSRSLNEGDESRVKIQVQSE
jgi:hypothetical protein